MFAKRSGTATWKGSNPPTSEKRIPEESTDERPDNGPDNSADKRPDTPRLTLASRTASYGTSRSPRERLALDAVWCATGVRLDRAW